MTAVSEEQRAEYRRATERARTALKPGDRLYVTGCGGTRATVTFTGFQGAPYDQWMTSKTRDDIHAMHILRVNGEPKSFADPVEA